MCFLKPQLLSNFIINTASIEKWRMIIFDHANTKDLKHIRLFHSIYIFSALLRFYSSWFYKIESVRKEALYINVKKEF